MDFSEYKYKLEMHCHSKPVSFCARCTVQEVAERYKALGYDGIVLTNHFNKSDCERRGEGLEKFVEGYIKDYRDLKEECEKLGIRVYLGMEIKFSNVNANEYLVYGVDEDDVRKAAEYLEGTHEDFYKGFKNDVNLIYQAHPFRQNMVPMPMDFLDGYEVFNMHPGHNSAPGIAAKYAAQFEGSLKIGGSDFHEPGREGMIALCTKILPGSSKELTDILKKQDFVFRLGDSIIIP